MAFQNYVELNCDKCKYILEIFRIQRARIPIYIFLLIVRNLRLAGLHVDQRLMDSILLDADTKIIMT